MTRFVAFDVETPNRLNHRMSAIGIAVVEDGDIVEEFYSLVNPETYFEYFNTRLTGIDKKLVRDAPTFPEMWEKAKQIMAKGVLVAHNAAFDLGVLDKCLGHYKISWKKQASYLCTVQMGRKLLPDISHKLNAMCEYYGIDLHHHRAESDSRACAEILLRYLKSGADPKAFIHEYYFGGGKSK